jgi:hypothetical protein
MGDAFDSLAPAVRHLHEVVGESGAVGRATVRRGRSVPARLVAAIVGFPPEGEHALHVRLAEEGGSETWSRDFGGRSFASRMGERDGLLVERFGPLRFGFALPVDGEGALTMVMRRWWFGPIPMPMALAPRAPAREWQEEGLFSFEVSISLPLIGLVVAYRGWLDSEAVAPAAAAA